MATTTARTTARRAATPPEDLGEDKARVTQVTTKEFIEKKDEKNTATQSPTASAPTISSVPPAFFLNPHTSANPRNSLAYLAEILSEDGEDQYVAIITRLADVYNDNFHSPSFADQNFPPMQFSPQGMMINFIPSVQKFNNNSGGRFSIVVCQMNGEPIDGARLTNFVIANPPRTEAPITNGNGSDAGIVALMREMMEQNQRNMRDMIASIQAGKSDRLQELAEQVMLKKLTEDSKPSASFEEMMMKMFTMPAMVETMAESFRNAMNGGAKESDDSPTWMKVMNSPFGEKIGERAGGILEGLMALGSQIAQQKMQQSPPAAAYQPPYQPPPQEIVTVEPLPNPAQDQTVKDDETTEEDEMKNLIEDIVGELESENVIDDNNEFMKELAEDYPMEAEFVKMLCKSQPFEKLTAMLMQKAPSAFEGMVELSEDGKTPRLNERGVKVENRLREFYEYYRAKD